MISMDEQSSKQENFYPIFASMVERKPLESMVLINAQAESILDEQVYT